MKRLPRHGRPHQLDMVGAALMIAAATTVAAGAHLGRHPRAVAVADDLWRSSAASFVLSAVFVWWLRRAPEPFLPLTVLANPVMRVGTAATACALGAVIGLTVYMPLYFQLVHKLSATQAGLALIPDRGDDDAGLDAVRPLDDVSAPLQDHGHRRAPSSRPRASLRWSSGRRCRSTA